MTSAYVQGQGTDEAQKPVGTHYRMHWANLRTAPETKVE